VVYWRIWHPYQRLRYSQFFLQHELLNLQPSSSKYIENFLCSYLFLTLRIALSKVIVKAMLSVLRPNQTARSFDVPDGTGATPKPILVPPVVFNVLRRSGSVGPSTCEYIDEVPSMFSPYSTATTPTRSVQSIRESVPRVANPCNCNVAQHYS
jgi:hypothetical protein